MRRNGLCIVKTIILVFLAFTISLIISSYVADKSFHDLMPSKSLKQSLEGHPNRISDNAEKNLDIPVLAELGEKIDWHNYKIIEHDVKRKGIGELGRPAYLKPEDEQKRVEYFNQNGFNAFLSDQISVNRSVPDIRYKGCKTKKYLQQLPDVSIIIPFYNEHWSTLLRSVYSVLNRSPTHLIKEIILVDDYSSKQFLKDKLQKFVDENLPKVKILRLSQRSGLIVARMAGARAASGKVLIFLDSHVEANYNWLPPLLEPIAENPKTCVCPFIDVIDFNTFEYRAQDEGARGAFDWEFYYKRLELLPEDLLDRSKPFKSPVMAGGLFAIGTDFFWELEGYDEGLDIWGGEQYELSFKIWMCGGEMYDASCSRVGHIYRGHVPFKNPRGKDYLHKNYKRVAEVWMDEYKNYLYERNPDVYLATDAGDLTKQKALRERLQCKSFKWFMENVAFDLPKKYPPVEPDDYAYGTVQSISNPAFCLDTLSHPRHSEIGLYSCALNLIHPQRNQNWALSWHQDLRIRYKTDCLDVSSYDKNSKVLLWECHGQQGNQRWYYNDEKKWLMHGRKQRCLEADITNRKVYVNDCDESNKYMKWNFGFVNKTMLATFQL